MALPDAQCPDGNDNAPEPAVPDNALKVCYYCGKRVRVDAPRCETCGNDRSFTWTREE